MPPADGADGADLTKGPTRDHLLRLAVPAAMGALFGIVFGITDTFAAGFWSTDAQAALAFCYPLYYVVLAFTIGMGRAATGIVARRLGEGDGAGAGSQTAQVITASVVAGVAVAACAIPLSQAVLQGMGATDLQTALGVDYITLVFAGAPVIISVMAVAGVLSAHGDTRTYRNALAVAALVNAVLDPVLMFGWLGLPRLGMQGVALATLLSHLLILVWLVARAASIGAVRGLRGASLMPKAAAQIGIAAQAWPPTLNMLCIGFGIYVYTRFLGQLDTDAVAAYGIASRVDQVVQLFAGGVSTALLAVAGQSFGARLFGRLREAFRRANLMAAGVSAAGGVLMVATGKWLLWLFNTEEAIIGHGYTYLVLAAVIGPMHVLLHNCVVMMQAVGRPVMILPSSLLRMAVLPTLLCWLFVTRLGYGVPGVWAAMLLSNLAGTAIILLYLRSLLAARAPVPA